MDSVAAKAFGFLGLVAIAGIIYQTVKPGSQGPQVTGQITGSLNTITNNLFKN